MLSLHCYIGGSRPESSGPSIKKGRPCQYRVCLCMQLPGNVLLVTFYEYIKTTWWDFHKCCQHFGGMFFDDKLVLSCSDYVF